MLLMQCYYALCSALALPFAGTCVRMYALVCSCHCIVVLIPYLCCFSLRCCCCCCFNFVLHVQSEVDTESVGHVLCKKADELDAVAICMATHNKGRMAEFFLGSVTQYCTHHSKRPVIIVPTK